MFKRILVPIDLRRAERFEKTLDVVEKLAKPYGSTVIFVGVSTAEPSEVARNSDEFADKLAEYAHKQGKWHEIPTECHTIISTDPAADLDKHLLDAIAIKEADLVVMATHTPTARDFFFGNHGNYISDHAKVSVFLVRPD